MDAGYIRRQDPVALAHWIARISHDLPARAAARRPARRARRAAAPCSILDPQRHPTRGVRLVFDTVIRGGTIVDGTGAAPLTGDVGIHDGRIVAVGSGRRARPARRSTPTARIVTPGFVDLHTHYDGQVTWDDTLEPSATNGITTVVLGNCGVGFAPVRPDRPRAAHRHDGGRRGHPRHARSATACRGASGRSFGEYLDVIDGRALRRRRRVPHRARPGALLRDGRAGVRGHRTPPPTTSPRWPASSREAFDAGAAGFSSNRFRGAHVALGQDRAGHLRRRSTSSGASPRRSATPVTG